eukprot:689202_1
MAQLLDERQDYEELTINTPICINAQMDEKEGTQRERFGKRKELDPQKGTVFYMDGDEENYTQYFIKIHGLKHYKLSMEYRCTGSRQFWARFKCFDDHFQEITGCDTAPRYGEPAIVCKVHDDKKTIECDRRITGWSSVESQNCNRIIGFYYNGYNVYDRVRADDYISYTGSWREASPMEGAYHKMNGRILTLSKAIPQKIEQNITPNTTVIMNHGIGCTNNTNLSRIFAVYDYTRITPEFRLLFIQFL